ncbi:MAG TPA: general secretion pathway protein, partial [Arenimonas sp.]|nr:general secretion pathway protein [Arenimonas sp.]
THRLALPAAVSALPVAPPAQKAPAEAPEPTGTAIDPRQLLAEAGLRPRLRNGRLDGFTLIQRGDGRTLRSAGLRSGDVLLAVNGEELTPERMAELGQMLQSGAVAGGATTLTLERDDQRHTITLQTESP